MAQPNNNNNNGVTNGTAVKPVEPQDPLGRSLANQRTEKKLAWVYHDLRNWAQHNVASLPLGRHDPIVYLIHHFMQGVPPVGFRHAGMAATGILLVSTFDSEIFVTLEDLENYFGVNSNKIVTYYNKIFGLFQQFVSKTTCGLSYGVHRRQILASTPVNGLKSIFVLEDPPNSLRIVNENGQEVHQLVPNNEYYLRKIAAPGALVPLL